MKAQSKSVYTVCLPDGSQKEFPRKQPDGRDLAQSVSPGLLKVALGLKITGREESLDIRTLIEDGEKARILTSKDPESLQIIRHSAAHVLAQAVQSLWPDVKVTIGPVISGGFYYDFDTDRTFTPQDLTRVEEEVQKLLKKDYEVTKEVWPVARAIKYFEEKEEALKVEIIRDLKEKEGETEVSVYRQGSWLDLCRGPHVQRLGQIGAMKVLNVSGAYWRGDSRNKQLQRIYGTAFHREKDLKAFLKNREEAARHDHRLLGKKQDLFWFSAAAPGQPFFTSSGTQIYLKLQDFLREKYRERGYEEIITPQVYHSDLFERSGHLRHFAAGMTGALDGSQLESLGFQKFFKLEDDTKHKQMETGQGREKTGAADFSSAGYDDKIKSPPSSSLKEQGMIRQMAFLKPMNCPGHCLLYKKERRSYRDLPWRVADFGRLHRSESGGSLHGLTRVRAFCQDDAHIFCRPDQLSREIQNSLKMLQDIYRILGLSDYSIALSTRPADRMGGEALWDQAEKALREALQALDLPFQEDPGEGAFYGPKLDVSVRDSFSRPWQLGTFQCDFNLPEAFDLEYVNIEDRRERPVMIHRAVLGSLERFIGLYLEHRRGRLPLWLCPAQAVLLPVGESDRPFAKEIQKKLEKAGILCKMDGRDEKLSYKIRQAQLLQIPYMIIIGKKEAQTGTLSLRLREGRTLALPLEGLVKGLLKESESRALHSVFSESALREAGY